MTIALGILLAFSLQGETALVQNNIEQCLYRPLSLIGDADNCHIFYQCDQMSAQAQSCGNMMFNSLTQVCDWPYRVMQVRPECRDTNKVGQHQYPFYRQRALRMINHIGDETDARSVATKNDISDEKDQHYEYKIKSELGKIIKRIVLEQVKLKEGSQNLGETKVAAKLSEESLLTSGRQQNQQIHQDGDKMKTTNRKDLFGRLILAEDTREFKPKMFLRKFVRGRDLKDNKDSRRADFRRKLLTGELRTLRKHRQRLNNNKLNVGSKQFTVLVPTNFPQPIEGEQRNKDTTENSSLNFRIINRENLKFQKHFPIEDFNV